MRQLNMALDDSLNVWLDSLHEALRTASKVPIGSDYTGLRCITSDGDVTQHATNLLWPSGEIFVPFSKQKRFLYEGTFIAYHTQTMDPEKGAAIYRDLLKAYKIAMMNRDNAVSKRNLIHVLLELAKERVETMPLTNLLALIRARPDGRLGRPPLIPPEVKALLPKP